MVLGFGFNKVRVLSAAEKYVQQGKLHHAIAEYEKVAEKDTKDLTVLNTIGDLYARLNQTDKAAEYFKKVGDTYSGEGFTVKAIAMYKKLTKLNPSSPQVIQRLAELYSQQGLYTDARQQYMQLADWHIRQGDNESAVRVFQRMLELDPENVALQTRLADLYERIGKKTEARDVHFRIAMAAQHRGAAAIADQALNRVLTIDPTWTDAIIMRGKLAIEAGEPSKGVQILEKIADLDSRPEALRVLLKGRLALGQLAEAEPIAHKLLTVHNDLNGLRSYAEVLLSSGQTEKALAVFCENADRLLSVNLSEVVLLLHSVVNQVKENIEALETIKGLFLKANAKEHIPEINELLAHALVKAGELSRARDLYKELAEIEPSNPTHLQNYRQVMGRLGEDVTIRTGQISESEQAFFVDELQTGEKSVNQEYPNEVAEAINSAVTDAELFDSYNKPQQALPALEAVLVHAPRDVRLNHRLAVVYSKTNRLPEAANCCDVIAQVYAAAGREEEARQYTDMAARYRERVALDQRQPKSAKPLTTSKVVEPEADFGEIAPDSAEEKAAAPLERRVPDVPTFEVIAAAETSVVEPSIGNSDAAGEAHEIDLSAEWEAAVMHASESLELTGGATSHSDPHKVPTETEINDLVEEIRFYVAQAMWDEAQAGIQRCESFSPNHPELEALKRACKGPQTASASALVGIEIEPESSGPLYQPEEVVEAAQAILEPYKVAQVTNTPFDFDVLPPEIDEHIVASAKETTEDAIASTVADTAHASSPEPEASNDWIEATIPESVPKRGSVRDFLPPIFPSSNPAPVNSASVPTEIRAEARNAPSTEAFETQLANANADISTLGSAVESQPEGFPAPLAVTHEASVPEAVATLNSDNKTASAPENLENPLPVAMPEAAGRHEKQEDLNDFVLDLEESLGENFVFAEPVRAATNGTSAEQLHAVASIALNEQQASVAIADAPVIATPPAESMVNFRRPGGGNGTGHTAQLDNFYPNPPEPPKEPTSAQEANLLTDLFAEFKEEVEHENSGQFEDPETHYNLGVAFKEMGLLDEAIGELQKVCQLVERGTPFPHSIQAYTWLAQCFLDKGVPEASVRWYEKALRMPTNPDTQLAVHYELASAYEASGDKRAALQHFMEVYGTNIDYRDVAERIKALKS